MLFTNQHLKDQDALSERVFTYYNNKKDDRNLLQASDDGLVHHHFGLGPTSPDLDLGDQKAIMTEIQRQENVLTQELEQLMHLGPDSTDTILDAGCGRGGTMIYLLREYPLINVYGINLTDYQTEFVKKLLAKEQFIDRAHVRRANYLTQPYQDSTFDQIYLSEVTQYAYDLSSLFQECARTLRSDGYLNILTWCYDPSKPDAELREIIEPINDHYASTMHPYPSYQENLVQTGFDEIEIQDVSDRLIPYWELRERWELKSGIEPNFLKGHSQGHLRYLFIRAKLTK